MGIPEQIELNQTIHRAGIKPSYQRLRIYRFLLQHPVHPTVDMIYKALTPEIPTLSKTTVYNTLKLFSDQGLIQTLTIEENENRYDADPSFHGHFRCQICGGIFDFAVAGSITPGAELAGFHIRRRKLYFDGICLNCTP